MANIPDELDPSEFEIHVEKILKGKGSVKAAREIMRIFCERAKLESFPSSFPLPILQLLVYAFEGYLSGGLPDLEKSLGVKKPGRPPQPKIRARNIAMVADVIRLNMKKRTLTDNRKGAGAFSKIAEIYGVSAEEVRDQYFDKEIQNEAVARIVAARLVKPD